jgi:hypothetical protein
MARLLTQQGLTANTTIGSPAQNMKWIVKWAMIVLHTGSGTGTRNPFIYIARAGITANTGSGILLATAGSQTSTNGTFYGNGDVVNNGAEFTNLLVFSQFPEVFAVDVIGLWWNSVSGDTVDYYIMVEEASS